MAESEWFLKSKRIGRWFEGQVQDVLRAKPGVTVVESEPLKYQQKRGWDLLVSLKGEQAYVECKLDLMAEITRNVCVEDSSINQSISPIWIYGIPTAKPDSYVIDLYTMYLSRLKSFTARYPIQLVGEFKSPARIIPRHEFIDAQDGGEKVVNHFHTLTYETKPRILLPF
jgi:hypothetical protein